MFKFNLNLEANVACIIEKARNLSKNDNKVITEVDFVSILLKDENGVFTSYFLSEGLNSSMINYIIAESIYGKVDCDEHPITFSYVLNDKKVERKFTHKCAAILIGAQLLSKKYHLRDYASLKSTWEFLLMTDNQILNDFIYYTKEVL